MNESLIHLYELQKIDSAIDDLVSSRGELPFRVAEMRDELTARENDLADIRKHVSFLESEVRRFEHENEDLDAKLERYKGQQFDVKTTREYDAISYQIEDADHKLRRNRHDIGRLGIELENVRTDEQSLAGEYEQVKKEFAENEATLKELEAETAEEEKRLKAERTKIAAGITGNYISMYERIRPAKEGVAVVAVRNGACGGCFNVIPRQLVLELKRGDKHTVCESCGRIVLGDTVAIAVDGEPQPVVYDVEEETGDDDLDS